MQRLQDLNDMFLFAQVVEHGSYTAAARALGLQVSRISRRISELERQLGVRLLNRTTRSISLSESGQTFHGHCVAVVAEAQAATEAIEQTRSIPRGVVRVSCPPGLLESTVAGVIARYLVDHPQVRIVLDATNRRVDVVDEGVDIAIRVRQPPLEDSDLAVRPLGDSAMLLVGSPWLFENLHRPQTLAELAGLPTLSMARSDGRHVWNFLDRTGALQSFSHLPRLVTDDMNSLRRAALEGLGVTLLPDELVIPHIEEGTLDHVLCHLSSPRGVVHAVFPSRRGLVRAVRELLDALVLSFATANADTTE